MVALINLTRIDDRSSIALALAMPGSRQRRTLQISYPADFSNQVLTNRLHIHKKSPHKAGFQVSSSAIKGNQGLFAVLTAHPSRGREVHRITSDAEHMDARERPRLFHSLRVLSPSPGSQSEPSARPKSNKVLIHMGPAAIYKKARTRRAFLYIWLGDQDSNLGWRSQSPQSYR